jgi:thiamine monophosphate synthase
LKVGFSQIAIFDTHTVSVFLKNNSSDLIQFCQNWLNQVISLGGDAIILRDSTKEYGFYIEVLKHIQNLNVQSLPLICNHRHQTLIPGTQGIHYKRGNVRGIELAEGFAGISAHSTDGCRHAERCGFDYVFLSPIFLTRSHPGESGLGLEKLSKICASTHIPVFALGGITQDNRHACLAAGAKGTASISLYMPD